MSSGVNLVNQRVEIPTHITEPDEKNPIFYENRNVQGAAGDIFPMSICTGMDAAFRPMPYQMLKLENQYIETTLLPELGGRIYTALDKSNGYDFIYRNHTIKPQQIGLCGPWISGGIEFNWPQHHRPTTFRPVDWHIEENPDGSKTVWMGEVEPLNHTKGMVGVTVYPGKSYIEAKIRLFNRTPYPQTFMWWANLAVSVNKQYRAVFPEDIHWASGHAWANTSTFPLLQGRYMDAITFDQPIDVRDHGKMPLGSSFFTYNSKYDFLSGYDFSKSAGIVHIADRHVSPGKKMFTWGESEFSNAWFRNLSDGDGPYVELMTGVYTCNQPDFSWIMPYEYKTAEQYWYPIREIGEVKSANLNGAIGFERDGKTLKYSLNTTELREGARVVLTHGDRVVHEQGCDISPDHPYHGQATTPDCPPHELELTVYTADGRRLISYRPEKPEPTVVPEPLKASPHAEDMTDADEIYLHALHLYQYRHPYLDPMTYLLRGLQINPEHADCLTLAGKIAMKKGRFDEARAYFQHAIRVVTQRNPNPYDTEAYYNLGLLEKLLGRNDEAYEALYKAVWVFAHKSSGYLQLAEIDCIRRDWDAALRNVEQSTNSNGTNFKAMKLRAMVLRRLGRYEQAFGELNAILQKDPLDFIALYEKTLLLSAMGDERLGEAQAELNCVMRDTPEYYLDVALDYSEAGFDADALDAVHLGLSRSGKGSPVLAYYQANLLEKLGRADEAAQVRREAKVMDARGCLHSRLETIPVLQKAAAADQTDAVAPYLLGNIYYGAKAFDEAIAQFELSVSRGATFPTVYRNLAIGYFDKLGRKDEAGKLIRKAFDMDPQDARVFFELTQYLRSVNAPVKERLALFEANKPLLDASEDLYAKYVSALIEDGQYRQAKALLLGKTFHPYEGGEALISTEYYGATLLLGQKLLADGAPEEAIKEFIDAQYTPDNFNSGKLPTRDPHARTDYLEGLAHEVMGETDKAKACYRRALVPTNIPEMSYYTGMAYRKLGENAKAEECFRKLEADADQLLANNGRATYFSRSLVTTLPFEHDTARNEQAQAHYLKGIALAGLGRKDEAKAELEQALNLKASNYWAAHFLKTL